MGWRRPRSAYGHTVRRESDFTSAPFGQLLALGLQFEVASQSFGAVFAVRDPRVDDCLCVQAGLSGHLHTAQANTREALAPSVRCSGVMEWALCRFPFPHSTAAALGAPAVPDGSETSDLHVQYDGVQCSLRSCFSLSTAASRKLRKVIGTVVRFEGDSSGHCLSLEAVSKALLGAARALRQRPLHGAPELCRAEDVSCPPSRHSFHVGRPAGAHLLREDESFPPTAPGICLAASTGAQAAACIPASHRGPNFVASSASPAKRKDASFPSASLNKHNLIATVQDAHQRPCSPQVPGFSNQSCAKVPHTFPEDASFPPSHSIATWAKACL